VHGGPVAWGDHHALGIADLSQPLFGDAVQVLEGEVPVFWACGATPQLVAMQCRPPLCVTHAPGHMFVSDVSNEALAGAGDGGSNACGDGAGGAGGNGGGGGGVTEQSLT
jgi:Protein of unknown function (DUF1445)